MRYFILLLCIFFFSQTQAQFKLGAGVKYNANNNFKAFGINGKIEKDVSDAFDVGVDAGYYFGKNISWSFDASLNYHLMGRDVRFQLIPMAGINFSKTANITNSLLLGLSARVVSDNLTYFLEPRWIFNNDQIVLNIGVFF
ncbi:MAG: hypothetical protein J5I52_04580 [Saprospiraceae bacterium]|nr:MAG: hypothetical protein UZ09_BCD002000676 [Bacteroidetes bacterium OLB9]MCO6463406.1 hypothetical protein [Saprospiraceae bacterium]MCZ2339798.1 hypothetical protein [Chitinophagales bacterium]